ncbi:MAG: MoaD/ThiS family protein [Dehalococcoidales bacterium]|nr:MoaD/ThiS family protein [Dehalococcoidales bacterium]
MKIRVRFLLDFVKIFGRNAMEVKVPPNGKVSDLIDVLFDSDEKRGHIFSEKNYLKGHFLLNGVNILGLDGLHTLLNENDEVVIMPNMSGG